jgi:hypothetical protein
MKNEDVARELLKVAKMLVGDIKRRDRRRIRRQLRSFRQIEKQLLHLEERDVEAFIRDEVEDAWEEIDGKYGKDIQEIRRLRRAIGQPWAKTMFPTRDESGNLGNRWTSKELKQSEEELEKLQRKVDEKKIKAHGILYDLIRDLKSPNTDYLDVVKIGEVAYKARLIP